jgi:hypothetical protein
MKKKTIVPVTLVCLFIVGLVALAPYLFHKPPSAKPDTKTSTVIASSVSPKGNPASEIAHSDNTNPGSEMTHPNPDPGPNSRVNSERKDLRPIPPKPRNISPGKPLPVIGKSRPPQPENHSVPTEKAAPIQTVISDPVAPSSDDSSNSTDQSSRWGIAALATESGVDVGVVYKLAELPILGGIDLDAIVATQQAGIGVCKDVSQNLGVGVTGTVEYATGDAVIGVYVKYSF